MTYSTVSHDRIELHGPSAEEIVRLEKRTIETWVASCASMLTGRVLDYGCGLQPYRRLVEAAGGTYTGWDRRDLPSNVSIEDVGPNVDPLQRGWDAILCTQILQYVPLYQDRRNPVEARPLDELLEVMREALADAHGWLILTGGTCWREIEPADHSRLTANGVHHLLRKTGFQVLSCASRASIDFPGFSFSLGWGALARA